MPLKSSHGCFNFHIVNNCFTGKFLLMLQSLKRAYAIDADHPWLHRCVVHFFKRGERILSFSGAWFGLHCFSCSNLFLCIDWLTVSESKDLPESVSMVLRQEISRLFGDDNAQSYNQTFLTKHSNSIPHRVAGTKAPFFCKHSTFLDSINICFFFYT